MLMLLKGVAYLHDNWILHRVRNHSAHLTTRLAAAAIEPPLRNRSQDLKPNNLLIRSDGVLKITDFGSARLYGGKDDKDTYSPQAVTRYAYARICARAPNRTHARMHTHGMVSEARTRTLAHDPSAPRAFPGQVVPSARAALRRDKLRQARRHLVCWLHIRGALRAGWKRRFGVEIGDCEWRPTCRWYAVPMVCRS
jgi:hypothetical protein